MQKREKEDKNILEVPLEKHPNKKIITILVIAIILVVVAIFGFFIYLYLQTPEHRLDLGANIENAAVSDDGKIVYIKLAGESNKNITKIKFIFTNFQGKEYNYETSEGTQEISIPFKRSFWDWLFGKSAFDGKYDYEIKAEEAGIENFNNIEEVAVVFEYKTETNQTIITPSLDVEKPTTQNKTTTGGGGGGTTDTGCTSTNPQASYACYNNDVYWYDNCNNRGNLKEDCSESCVEEECVEIINCTSNENCTNMTNVCAYGICNASSKCQQIFNSSTNVCRAVSGECDLAENCTGNSENCSTNIFKPQGTLCNNSLGICDGNGNCISNFCAGINFCSDYIDEGNCTADFCDKGICKWNVTSGSCYNYGGNVYYVDASGGNDSNDGLSSLSAWKTISKVNSMSFSPGDSILFKKGEIWRETLVVPSSGSSTDPITFGAYGSGENPTINGAEIVTGWTQYNGNIYSASISWTTYQVFEDGERLQKSDSLSVMSNGTWYLDDAADVLYVWCFDGSDPSTHTIEVSRYGRQWTGLIYLGYKTYIVVKDFNIKKSNWIGISSSGHHTIIENNTILYSYLDAIYLDFWDGAGADHSIINNNNCSYNNAPYDRWPYRDKVYYIGKSQAITVRTSDFTISNNIVSHNGNIGIDAYLGASSGRIFGNTVFDNLLNGIYLDGASSTEIYNNIVFNNGLDVWAGIGLASETGHPVENNRVYHNIVYDNFVGLSIDQGEVLNSSIINNVFLNNKYRAVYISNAYAANHKGNIFKNNIFVGKGVLFHLLKAFSENNTFDYNDWYRINGDKVLMYEGVEYTLTDFFSLTGQDVHSMSQDPMFVDQNNKNFHLQSTSPCIDAGTDVGLTEDFDETLIPQGDAPDIGAYEYKKSQVPASCYNGNMVLEWQDEFNGSDIDRDKWHVMWEESPTGAYGRRGGYWVANFSSVENGNLVIKTDTYLDKWGSGAVRTRGKFEPRYGYYEGRFKFTLNASGDIPKQITGHWPGFWLFMDTGSCDGVEVHSGIMTSGDLTYGPSQPLSNKCAAAWHNIAEEYGLDLPNADAPEKGLPGGMDGNEVDIFEYWNHNQISHNVLCDGYGKYTQKSGGYFASKDTDNPNQSFFDNLNLSDKEYHTVGLCWTPEKYIFYIDGVESYRVSGNKCNGSYLPDNSCASDEPLTTWFTTDFHRYMPGGVAKTPVYIKFTDEVGDNGVMYGGDMRSITDLPHYIYVDYIRVYGERGECGNNIKEAGEVCDGSDLNKQTCQSKGYKSGNLSCLADCSGFDFSFCEPVAFPTDYISYWMFDTATLRVTPDVKGINDGTLVGNAVIINDAERGNVLSLDGNGDYVNVPYDSSLDITKEITISALVKPKEVKEINRYIFSKRDSYFLDAMRNWAGASKPHFYVFYNGEFGTATSGSALTANQWNHIAVAYNSNDGSIRIYINGEQTSITNLGSNYSIKTSTYGVYIGADTWASSSTSFDGYIDDVMLFNRALIKEEIQKIYSEQSRGQPSLSPLTKLWEFLKSLLTKKTGNAITGNVVKWVEKRL